MASIYIITNKINNKSYVGQTKHTIEHRFKRHIGQINSKSRSSALCLAFAKYGVDNFTIRSIIDLEYDKEKMNELEKYYILLYNTFSPYGYNLTTGGDDGKQHASSIEKKVKSRGKVKITWGDKISISVKKLWENEEYRKKQTEQRKTKRGKYRKGIIKEKLRKEIDLSSFKEDYLNYMDLNEICDKYNISVNTIYRIIKRENIIKRGYKCSQIKK